jgi:hypothetical protein
MQPTIHCNKKPDIEAVNVRVFLLMNCGLHFLFIIPRESPCIGVLISQGATEIIMISSSDWTLPFYLYGGLTLGLFLVWHLLIYSNPHRDPHINPVERFYLDTEMSESRVRLPSSFHPPFQAQSSITRTRT